MNMSDKKEPRQYIVVREWQSKKRTNRISTGPFPTRERALAFADRHRYMNIYESKIYVVLFRPMTEAR